MTYPIWQIEDVSPETRQKFAICKGYLGVKKNNEALDGIVDIALFHLTHRTDAPMPVQHLGPEGHVVITQKPGSMDRPSHGTTDGVQRVRTEDDEER
jgi:hypothetical protein